MMGIAYLIMDIPSHLKKNKISQSDFAKTIGISKQLLNWHIKYPQKTWSKGNAEKIVQVIYGEIIREKVIDLILGE